ncbi:hypothetical protein TNIN_493591 [Trichonephila inaurata madagascariensis]|uniref:Uncharacterized protein n=1 Tax=Trichonephila inaurata madagascariensis TaxID=2747483 RepID=A0A8X6YBK3_9ARAC|nr:hypothetical protein TNIN_493591 [Trichonephila inaurata madagascariensis]
MEARVLPHMKLDVSVRGQEFYDPCDSGCPAGYLRNQYGECVSRRQCERMGIDRDVVQESPQCHHNRDCNRHCHRGGRCHHGRCICH